MCQEKSEQYVSIEMGGPLAGSKISCFGGFVLRQPCARASIDEYLAEDAKIEIPEGGITLKHGDEVIADIEAEHIEVSIGEAGMGLYLTIDDPAAYAKLMEMIEEDGD